MEAKDLRIGNVIEMYAIDRPDVFEVHVVEPATLMMLTGQVKQSNVGLRPIELTEERLLKLGFEIIDDNPKQKSQYEGDILFKILDFEFSNCIVTATVNERGFYSYQINNGQTILFYVHQLQNLYFALTGKELEVNL